MARSPLFGILRKLIQQEVSRKILLNDPARREFLKKALTYGAVAAPASSFLLRKAFSSFISQTSSAQPIAILGGGISGLTVAYRLSQAGIPCEIYEAASRLGGRIFTQNNFNKEGMFCELGGELVDTEHADVLDLAKELGLVIDDLAQADVGIESGHYFFGGQHYYEKDLLVGIRPLAAHLAKDMQELEIDFHAPIINYKKHNEAAIRMDRVTMSEYLYAKKDVDKWVLDLINIAYLGEYGADTNQQSAINLMLMMNPDLSQGFRVFGASDESKRIQGGNSRLIKALETAIRSKVQIHFESKLVQMRDAGGAIHLVFESRGKTFIQKPAQVICTLPFTTLRDVEGLRTLGLSPVKLKCIETLGYGINTKRMIGFKERIWRKSFGPILASNGYTFTDLKTQTYWDTSRAQTGQSGILTNFMGGSDAARPPHTVMEDLEKVYPGIAQNNDGNHAEFRWGNYPYSKGSYTCPKPGQVTSLIGSPAEPELGGRLLFAGEHVSEIYQGYINGAVQSANEVVKQVIFNS